jgi:hypothetical protein
LAPSAEARKTLEQAMQHKEFDINLTTLQAQLKTQLQDATSSEVVEINHSNS